MDRSVVRAIPDVSEQFFPFRFRDIFVLHRISVTVGYDYVTVQEFSVTVRHVVVAVLGHCVAVRH